MKFRKLKTEVNISQAEKNCCLNISKLFNKIIENGKEDVISKCPHCNSSDIIKHGHFSADKQRYMCKSCKRTFNEYTKSILNCTKKKIEKWIQYVNCMDTKMMIRKSAAKLNISNKTAFYWRHKILNVFKIKLPEEIRGIVEIKTTYIEESFKGRRYPENYKPEIAIGGIRYDYKNISDRRVCVICCQDREGNVFSKTLCRGPINYKKVEESLKARITSDSIICTDNNMAYVSFAKVHGVKLYKINYLNQVIEEKYHIKNASIFEMKLKNMIFKCRGVCTRYINFYIGWVKWSRRNLSNRIMRTFKIMMETKIMFRNKDLNLVAELG